MPKVTNSHLEGLIEGLALSIEQNNVQIKKLGKRLTAIEKTLITLLDFKMVQTYEQSPKPKENWADMTIAELVELIPSTTASKYWKESTKKPDLWFCKTEQIPFSCPEKELFLRVNTPAGDFTTKENIRFFAWENTLFRDARRRKTE